MSGRESPRQLEQRDLRPSPEPDGKSGGAYAAIDIKLCASVFVPSAGVAIKQVTDVEPAVDSFQRQLPTMRVPGERQINRQLSGAIEHELRRFMCQQDIDCT